MSKAKYYRLLSGLCLLLSIASFSLYVWKGSSVDSQGVLHESFGLVPMAWLFLAAGVWYGLRYRGAARAETQKEKNNDVG